MIRRSLFLMTAGLLLTMGVASMARAVPTPEDKCQASRFEAAGKYAACQQNAQAALETTGNSTQFDTAVSKCRVNYTATWAKLQAKFPTTSCGAARFVNNGNGTVTDNLTGLQWEKKGNLDGTQNSAHLHDADNTYTWTATGTAADGTAYTDFLATLNRRCFAGQCDWRLPTVEELQTILDTSQGLCGGGSGACIDPIFGPTAGGFYWSSTSIADKPFVTWGVISDVGNVFGGNKSLPLFARGVRAGL